MKTKIDFNELTLLSRAEIQKIKESDISLSKYPISSDETMKWQGGIENYLFHGKSAINLIEAILKLTYRNKSDINNILDFPCGHGRVLRFLKSHFIDSNLYACDLDVAGVEFCSSVFGAFGVHSSINLDKVQFDTQFDLIWCGSLLTHINSDKWPSFFRFFDRVLNKQGILVFTYAGSFVKQLVEQGDHNFIDEYEANEALKNYMNSGFGFMQYNTHDFEYGRTICSPLWVRKFLENYKNYRTIIHFERGWGARQDVIAIIKET